MATFRPSTPVFINISLLAVVTTVLLLFGGADYLRVKKQYYNELVLHIEQTTEQMAASLALTLWNFQDDQTRTIVENGFMQREIQAILVTDTLSGRVVSGGVRAPDGSVRAVGTLESEFGGSGVRTNGQPETKADAAPDGRAGERPETGMDGAGTGRIVRAERSIVLHGRVLGTIAVQGTTAPADARAAASLRRIAVSIITLDLLIFLLLNSILKRFISTPLRRIENFARTVSMSDGVSATAPDDAFLQEMNSLRQSMVIMVSRLQSQYDALRLAHTFIQEILDSMPSIVIGVEPGQGDAFRVTHCNKAAQQATGLDAGALVGADLYTVLPRMAAYAPVIQSAMREGRAVSLVNQPVQGEGPKQESVHSAQGGTGKRLETVMVFPVSVGTVGSVVIRLDDVTEQARMEELILQTEKMMSVGGLAAGMAHEINNPLAGILLGVQNIQRRFSPDLPANEAAALSNGCHLDAMHGYMRDRGITGLLQGIRESGERAARIVSNMLSFARQSQDSHTTVCLDTLLDKCIELASTDYDLKKKYDFKSIHITREYASDVPEVLCSPQEIEQVVLNLLRNAAQALFREAAADEGRVPRIAIRLYQDNGNAVIEVEDNGPGVPEESFRQVFEPFFTTKQPGEGTGLGLSVSYFIITRNHGGSIWLDTEYRGGARFCIRLPGVGAACAGTEENSGTDNPEQAPEQGTS